MRSTVAQAVYEKPAGVFCGNLIKYFFCSAISKEEKFNYGHLFLLGVCFLLEDKLTR